MQLQQLLILSEMSTDLEGKKDDEEETWLIDRTGPKTEIHPLQPPCSQQRQTMEQHHTLLC